MNTRRYKGKRISGEGGAVMIVEAAFVFPIMFFIVFIMLMAGSAYFNAVPHISRSACRS